MALSVHPISSSAQDEIRASRGCRSSIVIGIKIAVMVQRKKENPRIRGTSLLRTVLLSWVPNSAFAESNEKLETCRT